MALMEQRSDAPSKLNYFIHVRSKEGEPASCKVYDLEQPGFVARDDSPGWLSLSLSLFFIIFLRACVK